MVDPNRKINHLTEEDVKFLRECENEFKHRYTENDDEFMTYCEQKPHPPPIVEPWMSRRPQGPGNYRSGNTYRGHQNNHGRSYYGGGGGDYNRNDGNNSNQGQGSQYNRHGGRGSYNRGRNY